MKCILRGFDICFGLLNLTITNFGYLSVVTFTFSNLGIVFHLLDIGFFVFQVQLPKGPQLVLDSVYITFLFVPAFLQFRRLLFELFELCFDTFEFLGIVLAFDCLALNLQLFDLSVKAIQFFRFRIHFETQFSGSFID